MPKNIALFIDGTWNKADNKGVTNVHKLYKAAHACSEQNPEITEGVPVASAGATQITHYIEGVGTGGVFDRYAKGGPFGFGTERRIMEAYLFLALNYVCGDNVYLFGFSRGAFAARSLANFIGVVGPQLLHASQKKVAKAYKHYVEAEEENTYRGYLRTIFDIQEWPSIPVHFIGVWDTVRRLGVQLERRDLTIRWTKHHDHPDLPEHITHARHALALHDLRPEFKPTLWEDWKHSQSLQQVWFPGAHSDVGGGYAETEVSDVTLRWMACESAVYGLDFNPNKLPIISGVSSSRVHYEILFMRPATRKILSDWNTTSKQRMLESFFMHETACKQLLKAGPRQYWINCPAKSKSKSRARCFSSGGDYGALLKKVDQLTLSLHLALSFKYGKRLLR